MSDERAKALAKMKKRSSGSYDKVKDTEARAGGRSLPGSLEGETCVIHSSQLGLDKNDNPMLILKGSVVTPEEYKGVYISFSYFFNDSQFSTYDDCVEQFVNDMKLIGWDAADYEDEMALMAAVDAHYNQEKVAVEFNTARRANKNGEYRAFPNGPSDMEVESDGEPASKPKRAPKKTKKQAPAQCPFEEGDNVETTGDHFGDGNTYSGVVQSIDGDEVTVLFDDDNSEDQIPVTNLIKVGGGDEAGEEAPDVDFEEGDEVTTTDDYYGAGEEFVGVVEAVNDESCTVTFEDGTTDDIPFENLAAAS